MPEPTPTPTPTPTPPNPTPTPITDPAILEELAALRKEKAEWTKNNTPDPTLNDKVRKEQEDRDRKNSETKDMESAIMFNMSSADFLKTNESILPKDIADIFNLASRENYSTAIDKANATKSAIIQSFFSIQSNLEYLTPTQQTVLADYLKLTKNGKEEKARQVYENLFEPALSTLKKVKKAEELNRSNNGFGGNSSTEQAYKDKLINMGNKKFFRGKNA